MNLKPITEYLQGLGLAEEGVNLFLNRYPTDDQIGVLVRPRLSGADIDHELPGFLHFEFQVIVRSPKYEDAQTLAEDIAKALKFENAELPPWKVKYMRPQKVPVSFPLSAGRMVENNTSYSACVVDPTWV